MSSVAVLLPTFGRNANGRLAGSIQSVLDQTYKNFELVVIDDGSTDGSRETIRNFIAKDSRVKTVRFETNIGLLPHTTGIAALRSQGEFIAWQFDDCVWEPHHLETLVPALESNPEATFAYGVATVVGSGEQRRVGDPLNRDELERGNNHIPNVGALVRRSSYARFGWVDPNIVLKRANDWDFWCRASRNDDVVFVDRIVATEFGPSLPDSLGNSVSRDGELILKLSKIDRSKELSLANIDRWKPFQLPDSGHWSADDHATVAYLTMEHFLRVGRPDEAVEHIKTIAPDTFGPESTLTSALIWHANEMARRNQIVIREQQSFIQRQQAYIDQQQAYIDRREVRRILSKLFDWRERLLVRSAASICRER